MQKIKLIAIVAVVFSVSTQWTVSGFAGGGPENLLLIVNVDSVESLSIANEYIHLRKIPSRNVVYLQGITDQQTWDLENFKKKILKPIFDTMVERKLGHIDYIVYSAGFPTAINTGPHQKKLFATQSIPKQNRRVFAPMASINSLTYFGRQVLADEPSYMALKSNLYMRTGASSILVRPFGGEAQLQFTEATEFYRTNDYKAALDLFGKLNKQYPNQVAVDYWLAKTESKLDNLNQASMHLVNAIRNGWCYRGFTGSDEAFSHWKNDERFKQILERIPDQPFDFAPTTSFRGNYIWGPNGFRNYDTSQGQRYFLSTVLAVTRNRGTTEAEAIENLRRSVGADRSNPKGTFYFTLTKDIRTKTRAPHFDIVVRKLREDGFKAEVVNTLLPKQKKDIIGLSVGAAGYNMNRNKLEVRPGAIVENLTSFGGAMQTGAKQTPLSHAIKNGAAGSSGTVAEPYAILDKFPHPMIHVHYTRGCSLAEAFYQAVYGPYMLLIVGDALCQPWADPVQFSATESENPSAGFIEIDLKSEQVDEISRIMIFIDGKLHGVTEWTDTLKMKMDKISDGFHELRIVAIKKGPIQTQSSQIVPIVVNNRGSEVELTTAKSKFQLSESINLQVNASSGKQIAIYHNSRKVGQVDGSSGKVKIDATKIGRGISKLHAAAMIDGQWVFSQPVEIEISY